MPTARPTAAEANAAVWAAASDEALVAAYLTDAANNSLGVNYYLAQEMERRGFRSKRTAALTRKGARFLPDYGAVIPPEHMSQPPVKRRGRPQGTPLPSVFQQADPISSLAELTDEQLQELAFAVRTEGKRRRAAARRSS